MDVKILTPKLGDSRKQMLKILTPKLSDNRKAMLPHESNNYKPISNGDLETQISKEAEPWSVAQFCTFLVFGIASLTPWNMFITATSYFQSKFNGSSPDIEENFQNYFQTGAICSDVAFSFVTVALVRFIKLPKLIFFSNSVMLSMFVLTAVLAKIDSTTWPRVFFLVTEATFCLMCGSGSMFISSILGITATMNPIYIDAFLFGMTFSGLIAAVLNIVTISIPGIDFVEAGFWYFVAASVILLSALILFTRFQCQNFQRNYKEVDTGSSSSTDSSESRTKTTPIFQLIRNTLTQGYSCFMAFYITFLMFPAVLSTLRSTSDPLSLWSNKYFLPVSLFLVWHLGDLTGRIVARLVEFPGRRLIPWYTTARIIFVLLMVMCNLQPRSASVPVWFQHDVIPSALVFVFSAMMAQIFNLALRYAAEIGRSDADKASIGTIMGFLGAIGRVSGSLSTYLVFMAIK